jgi:hypothetical protein
MPGILHYPTADIVLEGCLEKPLSISFIVFLGPFKQLLPRNRKLGTATHADDLGHCSIREQGSETLLIVFRGDGTSIPMRPNLTRAAQCPTASKIDVTLRSDIGQLKALEHGNAIY